MVAIYNSFTGLKEPLKPIEPKKIRMYVCGMTVYDFCHIGHARVMVVFDMVARYLRSIGFDLLYVRNITDIDDKIIDRANSNNESITDLTERYIESMNKDADALGVLPPDIEPKATEHMKEIIEMISTLIERKHAYLGENSDVYFDVSSFDAYGKLSGKNIDELRVGERVEVQKEKNDPLDFVLWKAAKKGEPSWPSPWGDGRPGWHIECSAMGRKYLGDTFDIHGGGKDLVFPHHENEIAQSCGVTGCPPVRFWVHNGFVNIDKEKMSKSLGNFFTLRDIYKKHHPETLRLFLVSSHYRSPIDFSEKNLEDAEKVLSRFYEALANADEVLKGGLASRDVVRKHPLLTKCEEAMNDDFNTSVVLALMNEELRAINTELDKIARGSGDQNKLLVCVAAFRLVGGLLGLLSSSPEKFKKEIFDLKKSSLGLDVAKIEKLIKDRDLARKGQDWGRADQCRDELTQMGVVLEDTPQGTEWKIQ